MLNHTEVQVFKSFYSQFNCRVRMLQKASLRNCTVFAGSQMMAASLWNAEAVKNGSILNARAAQFR